MCGNAVDVSWVTLRIHQSLGFFGGMRWGSLLLSFAPRCGVHPALRRCASVGGAALTCRKGLNLPVQSSQKQRHCKVLTRQLRNLFPPLAQPGDSSAGCSHEKLWCYFHLPVQLLPKTCGWPCFFWKRKNDGDREQRLRWTLSGSEVGSGRGITAADFATRADISEQVLGRPIYWIDCSQVWKGSSFENGEQIPESWSVALLYEGV